MSPLITSGLKESHALLPALPTDPTLRILAEARNNERGVDLIKENADFAKWSKGAHLRYDAAPQKLFRYFVYLLTSSPSSPQLPEVAARVQKLSAENNLSTEARKALDKAYFNECEVPYIFRRISRDTLCTIGSFLQPRELFRFLHVCWLMKNRYAEPIAHHIYKMRTPTVEKEICRKVAQPNWMHALFGLYQTKAMPSQKQLTLPSKQLVPVCMEVLYDSERSDERLLAFSCQHDRTIHIWEYTHGSYRTALKGDSRIIILKASPNGLLLASGSERGKICVWNWKTKEVVASLEGHTGYVDLLKWTPEGSLVSSSSSPVDLSVRKWNLKESKKSLVVYKNEETMGVVFLETLSENRFTIAKMSSKIITVIECEKPSVEFARCKSIISLLARLSNGRLASGLKNGRICIWDSQSGALLETLSSHTSSIRCLAELPDQTLLSGSERDKTFRLWDPASSVPLATFCTEEHVEQIQVFPQGDSFSMHHNRAKPNSVPQIFSIFSMADFAVNPINCPLPVKDLVKRWQKRTQQTWGVKRRWAP